MFLFCISQVSHHGLEFIVSLQNDGVMEVWLQLLWEVPKIVDKDPAIGHPPTPLVIMQYLPTKL